MKNSILTGLTIFLVFLFLTAISALAAPLQPARVTGVIDGDTIEVEFSDGRRERVRYIGVDTPEVYGKTEFFGEEASDYNRSLVDGTSVWLEFDLEKRDRYSRLLAYVYLDPQGDAMVNAILVTQGYATVATYPPNVKHVELFEKLQEEARIDSRGLWSQAGKADSEVEVVETNQTVELSLAVAITCIHFDATGNDHNNENGEWVVIGVNDEINFTGWTLSDEADHDFNFPANFALEKGETVKVYTGSEDDPKKDDGCGEEVAKVLYWRSNSAIWNNGGDIAYLKNNGKIVDSCEYSGEGEEIICVNRPEQNG